MLPIIRRRIFLYDPYLTEPGGGQKVTLAMARILAADHDVTLGCPAAANPADWDRWYGWEGGVDVEPIAEERVPARSRQADLFFNAHNAYWIGAEAPRNWLYCQFPIPLRRQFDLRHALRRRSPVPIRLERTLVVPLPFERPNHLASYERIFCNSGFSRRWIRTRLDVEAEVLELFSDFDPPPGPKAPIVLHVARIVPEKGAAECIELWRRIESRVPADWRLVIAGATAGWSPPGYPERLRRSARGLRVELRFDLPHDSLRELMAGASIFVHLAGLGQRASRPQLFEHFGLTAVEAMRSRCAPVLFRGGGFLDLVRGPDHGVLVDSLDEAAGAVARLAADAAACRAVGEAARAAAERFSTDAFAARLRGLLAAP